ncbi:MAG: HAD family hydrolase [Phycisphaerae bacterium]|nr:HAD family hydrolase [Phycisphaerae bacterium]
MNELCVDVILLDWGGTLARVARQIEAWQRGAQAACDVFARHGRSHPEAAAKLAETILTAEQRADADPAHIEVDARNVLAAWVSACGWEPPPEAAGTEALDAFGTHWIGCLDPLPGALEAVKTLRQRGYRLGLASNCWTPEAFCHAELRRHGFDTHLHAVTFSCEVGYRKPSPRFYRTALCNVTANGSPPPAERVLFVGDSLRCDVVGPAALGMRTAWIADPTAAMPSPQPDVCVRSVAELLEHLPGPA